MSRRDVIAVIQIRSGRVLCCTNNHAKAAALLEPGTTYGKAGSKEEAQIEAEKKRGWHLQNGY